MSIRDNLDISAYLVLGPENTLGRPVGDVVAQALDAGFTCIQVRSKVASAREIIALTGDAAQAIAQAGKTGQVALLIDDRLDCVLAAREQGIAVDGVHVGQHDMEAGIADDPALSTRCISVTDRRTAIERAAAMAGQGDVVLVAGKGHEDYQEVHGVKHHFDDREEIVRALAAR